jgi:hypothetical protein
VVKKIGFALIFLDKEFAQYNVSRWSQN